MKTIMLFTGSGPIVIMTSFDSVTEPGLLKKLGDKGISKFIAYEIPAELAEERYGAHLVAVQHDLHESDDLRVLDYDGQRAFKLFSFAELGDAIRYESGEVTTESGGGEVHYPDDVQ